MSNITSVVPFQFDNHEVRIIQDEHDQPWWVAKDICDVLGFGNPRQALSTHLDDTGTDCLALLDATHLVAEKQVQYFTPTTLGKQLGLSGIAFNQKLGELGSLQVKWQDDVVAMVQEGNA